MAHGTVVTGRYSELMAMSALMANGWIVAEPTAPESFDLVARCPKTRKWKTIQVKTARVRTDRNGEIVVIAKKGNGKHYTADEADLFCGVLGNKVYLFENRGLAEYWVTPDTVNKRWTELRVVI
jgi:16S rRNA G1207 methylase RsmC